MRNNLFFLIIVLWALVTDAQQPRWVIYNQSNSQLPENMLKSIALSENGSLWIGTAGGGAVSFDRDTSWRVYNQKNSGLPDDHIDSIVTDQFGKIWFASGNGLASLDANGKWTVYTSANSKLPSDDTYVIAIDRSRKHITGLQKDQTITWIGTLGAGVTRFDGSDWKTYNATNSPLPDNSIRSIVIDNSGNKWIGTLFGGLVKYNGEALWTIYAEFNSGLPHNAVYPVVFDSKGIVWIGTEKGGLARFDPAADETDKKTSWTVYNTSNSGLPHDFVYTLALESDSILWIGTSGGGAAKFYPYFAEAILDSSLHNITEKNCTVYNTLNSPLPHNEVKGIAIDDEKNVWFATSGGGLARLNESGNGWSGTGWDQIAGFNPLAEEWKAEEFAYVVKRHDILTPQHKEQLLIKLDAYLKNHPNDDKVLFLFTELAIKYKDYSDELSNTLIEVLKKNPDNPEVHYWIGNFYGLYEYAGDGNIVWQDVRDNDKAVKALKKAISLDVDNENYREYLALCLSLNRKFEEARAFIRPVKGEKHPIYLLLKDLQTIPLHETTVFLPRETKNLMGKMKKDALFPDYYELRVHVFAVPLSMAELEKFYGSKLPEFKMFETSRDKKAGIYSYKQFLRFTDGELFTCNSLAEIPKHPQEGIILEVTHYNPKKHDLNTAPSFVKEAVKVNPALDKEDTFCKIVFVSYR